MYCAQWAFDDVYEEGFALVGHPAARPNFLHSETGVYSGEGLGILTLFPAAA